MSFKRLQGKIDDLKNPTVVGLDTDLAYVPENILEKHIQKTGENLEAAALAVLEFNMSLIDALCDIIPAVKPQSAYYEKLGPHGVMTLKKTCDYARSKGMYIIVDGKRNDIGSTASAYSAAYLGAVKVGKVEYKPFDADALTVNAYLGSDGIKPFIEAATKYDKALFALVRTSNPSAKEFQDLAVSDCNNGSPEHEKEKIEPNKEANEKGFSSTLYSAVGSLIEEISLDTMDEYGYTRVGAVVGATYPQEAAFLREKLKNTFFLVPGYGAQGGSADDAAYAFDENGRGAIVNSSRGIIAAWKKRGISPTSAKQFSAMQPWAAAAREEALIMRDSLRRALYK